MGKHKERREREPSGEQSKEANVSSGSWRVFPSAKYTHTQTRQCLLWECVTLFLSSVEEFSRGPFDVALSPSVYYYIHSSLLFLCAFVFCFCAEAFPPFHFPSHWYSSVYRRQHTLCNRQSEGALEVSLFSAGVVLLFERWLGWESLRTWCGENQYACVCILLGTDSVRKNPRHTDKGTDKLTAHSTLTFIVNAEFCLHYRLTLEPSSSGCCFFFLGIRI